MQNVHEVNPSGEAARYRRGFMAAWLTGSRAARKHDVKRCRGLLTNKPSQTRQTRQTDRRGRCQGERGRERGRDAVPVRGDASARMTSPARSMRRRREQEAGRKQDGSRKEAGNHSCRPRTLKGGAPNRPTLGSDPDASWTVLSQLKSSRDPNVFSQTMFIV